MAGASIEEEAARRYAAREERSHFHQIRGHEVVGIFPSQTAIFVGENDRFKFFYLIV